MHTCFMSLVMGGFPILLDYPKYLNCSCNKGNIRDWCVYISCKQAKHTLLTGVFERYCHVGMIGL